MIVFIDEEHAYRYWIAHHRDGFVLDGRRRPKVSHLLLHRATCDEIKVATSPRTHWTTGGRFKACSRRSDELQSWGKDEQTGEVEACSKCQPLAELPQRDVDAAHLTKLARDVLDYVIESAVIHLEWPDGPRYRLNVSDIASCMAKTAGQVSLALHQLVSTNMIAVQGRTATTSAFSPSRMVWPTAAALKTLPGFANDDVPTLEEQLAKLR